jgi:hypothetical protein
MNLIRKQRASSVLGLALHGNQLEGVVLRRTNGSLQIQKTFSASLALSPLSADPELVGREIRNHLESAGIRERRCVVALPLSAALSNLIDVPDLPESDVASFLDLEEERSFPYGHDALMTSRMRFGAGRKGHAMLVAYQRSEMSVLDRALRAALLKPLSFSLGTAALQPPNHPAAEGVIALVLSDTTVDLQATAAGGIVALRSLSSTHDTEGTQKGISAELLAREIRITLGQLPAEFRDVVRKVRIFGTGEPARRFANDFAARAKTLGIDAQLVEGYRPDEFAKHIPVEAGVSAAFSLAARYLSGEATGFEFLPPRVKPWQQLTARFSSKKLAWIGGAAGATALIFGGAFAFQQWQLSRLDSEWRRMDPKVRELEQVQQQIRKFRPWFDERFTSLAILKRVTESFPAEGSVTAKTLEIRELSTVLCSGTASDNQALLRMLDQLRSAKEVSNVKVDQVRGKTPMQFTFNFQWNEGGASGH